MGFALCASAQPAQISGSVNLYTQVLEVDTCKNTLLVNSSAGFNPGDRALLIQMKGAAIDTSDSPVFGALKSLGYAGNFEFATVDAVTPSRIRLRYQIIRNYDISAGVQLVRIASYPGDVQTIGKVTGQKWNGVTGGIIVIEAAGNIALGADIDATGIGFRGGDSSVNEANPDLLGYKYPYIAFRGQSAFKGESIAEYVRSAETGRGPQYSGGGGGNGQNSGGGGGANGGKGGQGGDQTDFFSTRMANGGLGGIAIDYGVAIGRLFLGSGGGGGHENDGVGTPGARGGGIVIIKSQSIQSTGGQIKAKGAKADTARHDGSGGGGGGGTVLLALNSTGSPVTVDVTGGNGGDNDAGIQFNFKDFCYGPGAGGGGGIVKLPLSLTSVTVTANGGKAGVVTHPQTPCYQTTYGATDGADGITNNDITIPESTTPFAEPALDQHDIVMCEGDTARPRVTGPALIVQWTPTANISNPASFTPDLYPTATSTYTVSMQDSRGCQFVDSVRITVKPRPKPLVAGPDTVCSETEQGYVVTGVLPSSLKLWRVRGGEIVGDSTSDSVTVIWHTPFAGSITFLSAADSSGCTGIDSQTVVIFPTRRVALSGVRDMCEGDTIEVIAESGYSAYRWSTGDTTDRIMIGDSGTYYVEVFGGGPCVTRFDTFHVAIRIPTKPQIVATRDTITSPCQIVQLDAGAGYMDYLWSTGATTRTIMTVDSGTFIVTALDSIGCLARDTIEILRRDNGKARFTIKLDTLSAYAGEQVYYPLRVLSSENELLECSGEYRVVVHFNRSLLVPTKDPPFLWDRLDTRLRYVTFGMQFGPDINVTELPGLTFTATLGDTSETPIIIDSFFWDNQVVDYVKYDGLFMLLGVCEEGDTRYVYTSGIQYITTPRPNPADDHLQFSYSTLEPGYHELLLVDVMGRVAREILRASVEPAAHKVSLDVRDLPSGQYLLLMRTPTTVFKRAVRINR